MDHNFTSIIPVSHTQATSLHHSLQSNNLPPYSPCPLSSSMPPLPPLPPKGCSSYALLLHLFHNQHRPPIPHSPLLPPSKERVWGKVYPSSLASLHPKPVICIITVFCAVSLRCGHRGSYISRERIILITEKKRQIADGEVGNQAKIP